MLDQRVLPALKAPRCNGNHGKRPRSEGQGVQADDVVPARIRADDRREGNVRHQPDRDANDRKLET